MRHGLPCTPCLCSETVLGQACTTVALPGACLVTDPRLCCVCTALRIMEVRKAYCAEDFEWDICRAVAAKEMHEANVRLLRSRAEETFLRASAGSDSSRPELS